MVIGNAILSVIDFLSYPAWHLVVLYVFLFILVAYSMIKSWGF